MRTRLMAFGILALSLGATAANADEWWHHGEGRRDRGDEYTERRDMRWDEHASERDRARLDHELREGDWREAEQLRRRIWWARAHPARCLQFADDCAR